MILEKFFEFRNVVRRINMSNESAVKKLPPRNEVATEDTWRLEDIFANDEVWEKEFNEVKSLLPGVQDYQGKLGESADQLYNALQLQDKLLERLGRLYTY